MAAAMTGRLDESVLKFRCSMMNDNSLGAWCNGSTPDFESVDPGSIPGAPAYLLLKAALEKRALRHLIGSAKSVYFIYILGSVKFRCY